MTDIIDICLSTNHQISDLVGKKILSLIMIVLHCVKKNTIHWAASIQLTIGRSEGHGHLKKRSTWRSWQHVVSLSCPAVIVYAVCKKPNYQMSEDNEGSSAGVAVLSKSLETAGFRVWFGFAGPSPSPLSATRLSISGAGTPCYI